MSKVNLLISKYKKLPKDEKTKYKFVSIKFSPTTKWIEYSLDLLEARKLLQDVDFVTKFDIERIIKQIENKISWHEKHNDFDHNTAVREFRKARKLLQL
jgi:hypothetical protein